MKVITGGQRGVDLGAAHAARAMGLRTGGFVPLDGRTETLPLTVNEMKAFDFCEVAAYDYRERTRLNVGMADAVILISDVPRSPGTVLTRKLTIARSLPLLEIPSVEILIERIRAWIHWSNPSVLLIAGNRESVSPGIEARVYEAFCVVWKAGEDDQNSRRDTK